LSVELQRDARVVAVCRSATHTFSKSVNDVITLVAGLGVAGDAHAGATVKHRYRVAIDPTQPNLRQVHLVQTELHEELVAKGFRVAPGLMGENITTRGIDLLSLPRRTRLHIGPKAIVEITGLRNPCRQLHDYQDGLTEAVLDRDADGRLIRKAGIMGIVISGGEVRTTDRIGIDWPIGAPERLVPV
jgi:MOSC domain-containing protein YiiM